MNRTKLNILIFIKVLSVNLLYLDRRELRLLFVNRLAIHPVTRHSVTCVGIMYLRCCALLINSVEHEGNFKHVNV